MTNLTFAGLISIVVNLISSAIPVLGGAILLVFLFGLGRFVFSAGDSEKHESGKFLMTWGLVALFVMFSIWGLVRILAATFFPGSPLISL